MNLNNLILLTKRHIAGILIIAGLTTAFSAIIYYQYAAKNPTNATIFINIGSKSKIDAAGNFSPYEQVQAADMFTETIQGWFKNKELISKIEKQSLVEVSVTARKQEKQNLLVTFKTKDEQTAKKIAQSIRENLQGEIGAYNRNTESTFQIALFSVVYEQSSSLIFTMIVILGILLGFGLGMILCFLFETVTGKIVYDWQFEKELGMNALDKLSVKLKNSEQLNYLATMIQRIPNRHIAIIGIGFKPDNIIQKLSGVLEDRKFSALKFPEESQEILNRHGNDYIIVAKPGTSALSDLKRIKLLLDGKYYLIIQE